MDVVDPGELWQRWAAGDSTLRDAYLFGLKIFWWARIGKLVAFISGFLLVIDIVGQDRVMNFISKRVGARERALDERVERVRQRAKITQKLTEVERQDIRRTTALWTFVPSVFGMGLVIVFDLFGSTWVTVLFCTSVIVGDIIYAYGLTIVQWLYARKRAITVARIASFSAFVIGFFLDVLGS
jgi:hypothetical protein